MTALIETLTRWLAGTWLSQTFLDHGAWAWPLAESLHFIGLTFLVGGISLIDLRILGVGKGIRIADLHKLVVFVVAGFVLNVLTGSLFVIGQPDQYFLNRAFHFKLFFLAVAGLNVLLFYGTTFRHLRTLGPDDSAPLPARCMAAVSLLCWIGVICAGRLLTFYRP